MPAADPYIANRINGNTEGFLHVSDRYDPREIEELFAVSEEGYSWSVPFDSVDVVGHNGV